MYTIYYTLWCDYPNCNEHASKNCQSLKETRKFAQENGWSRKRNRGEVRDLCPIHSKMIEEKK